MKKLELRLDLFGDDEPMGTAGETAGAPEGQPAGTATGEGVNAQPQREGRRQLIFPAVPRQDVQRATAKPAARQPSPTAAQAKQETQPPAETWEDIKKRYKAEYGRDVQAAVTQRFRNQEDLKGQLDKAMGILGSIAPMYGIQAGEDGQLDMDKLTEAVNNDDRLYEQEALDKGIPTETAKYIHQMEAKTRRLEAQQRQSLEQERLRVHIGNLRQQEAELKREFPDFDLNAIATSNPAFVRMTGPDGGFTMRQAYMALYGDEILKNQNQATERRTQQNMSRAIQAGAMRPRENGVTGNGGGVERRDPRHMSRDQLLEDRRRVKAGERIGF